MIKDKYEWLNTLVLRAKAGNKAASDEIVLGFRALVLSTMQRLVSPEHYEDAYQEGFLAVLSAIQSYDPASGVYFSKYVQMRVQFCFLEQRRYDQKRRPPNAQSLDLVPDGNDSSPPDPADPDGSAEDQYLKKRTLDQIEGYLACLTQPQYRAIVAYYLEGKPQKTIAAEDGVTVSVIKGRINRGLKKMRSLDAKIKI